MRVLIHAVTLGLGCAVCLSAQQPVGNACLTNEALRHYRVPGSLDLSPDGRRVVFVIRAGAADNGESHIWWAEAGTPESARQITYSASPDAAGESDPHWMPDGSAILFLGHRAKHRQIYRLPANGGEAAPLNIKYPVQDGATAQTVKDSSASSSEGAGRIVDVGGFEISPDGRWLAIMASDPETPVERRKTSERNDAKIVDEDDHPRRVWLYSFAGDSLIPVSSDAREASSASWSRDSRQLAIVTRPTGNQDDLGPQNTLQVVNVATPRSARPVPGVPPTVSSVSWSPNGTWFAFEAQTMHDAPPGIADLFVMATAGGQLRDVTEKTG
ncbi:MAG: hypothetical protein ACRENQ_03395, partial [Gemmatimonadaceae bacterium]